MADLADQYAADAQAEAGDAAAKTHLLWRACFWYERAEGLYKKDPARAKGVARKRSPIEQSLPKARPVILFARYGAPSVWSDRTDLVERALLLAGYQKLMFPKGVAAALGINEPAPNQRRALMIVYRHHGRARLSLTSDADPANLTPPADFVDTEPAKPEPGQELTILYARYGIGNSWAEVAPTVQAAVRGKALGEQVANLKLDDPAPGKEKFLVVVYRYNGGIYFEAAPDSGTIILDPGPAQH
jgi:hypothetical protein